MERRERAAGIYTWNVYHEPADGPLDDPAQCIGTIEADTMASALTRAAQYYELPEYDLVVTRHDECAL